MSTTHEKNALSSAKVIGAATVMAAVVAGAFDLLGPRFENRFGPEPKPENVAQATEQVLVQKDWSNLQTNTPYVAPTDGFVSALSDLDHPSNSFDVFAGNSREGMKLRTRGTGSDGTITRVLAGQYWMVQNVSGHVIVEWLPQVLPALAEARLESGRIKLQKGGSNWLTWNVGVMTARGFKSIQSF